MNRITKHDRPFTLVSQPNDKTCVSACLAMVTGLPVADIVKRFNELFHANEITVHRFLQRYFPDVQRCYSDDHSLSRPGVYFLAVPSINRERGGHQVVWDARSGNGLLLDPNQGRPGVRVYERSGDSVRHYRIDAFIPWEA